MTPLPHLSKLLGFKEREQDKKIIGPRNHSWTGNDLRAADIPRTLRKEMRKQVGALKIQTQDREAFGGTNNGGR